MRKTLLAVLGILAIAMVPGAVFAGYDYPDPSGFDYHTDGGFGARSPGYQNDYPIFIHEVLVNSYSGSRLAADGTEHINAHERNLTTTRGMYPVWAGGEGSYYLHGWKGASHYVSWNNPSGGVHSGAGMWQIEEVGTVGDPLYVEFYMGGLYPVHEMWIWNGATNGPTGQHFTSPGATFHTRGLRDVSVYYKKTTLDAWTLLDNFTFGHPQFANNNAYGGYGAMNQDGPFTATEFAAMRPIDFGSVQARYVQWEITSNWGDPQWSVCNEARFYTEGSAYVQNPPRFRPYPDYNFGPNEIGGRKEVTVMVGNAGSAGSQMRFDSIDVSGLSGGLGIDNPIAAGGNLPASANGEALALTALGTVYFEPTGVANYAGDILIDYTDVFGTHRTTVSLKGEGRSAQWGYIPAVSDGWVPYQDWDANPSYSGRRMCDGTNMNEPAVGALGGKSALPGRRYADGTTAVWNWGYLSGYFGWLAYRHNWVVFDFGKVVNGIDSMHFFNGRATNGSVKDVYISYSTQNVPHSGMGDAPGGYSYRYPDYQNRPEWINAYGHYSGIEDTRFTKVPTTNGGVSGPGTAGVHQFAQVENNMWETPAEVVDMGGISARMIHMDSLHDGTPGRWGVIITNEPDSIQQMNNSVSSNPPGYAMWNNDNYIRYQSVRFYKAGDFPELKASLPEVTGNGHRSWGNPENFQPFAFPDQQYPFVTTQTVVHIGNVGPGGTSLQITDITFSDTDGDGSPDPGPFTVANAPALPATYAGGTTAAMDLVWTPARDLGAFAGDLMITGSSGGSDVVAVIPITANALVQQPGWIHHDDITPASLQQLGGWEAYKAADGAGFTEVPSYVLGSKGALQNNVNAWLDDIRVANGMPPLEDPHWIEFDLGSVRTLDIMNVYSHTQGTNSNWNATLKDVFVEYKVGDTDPWTRLTSNGNNPADPAAFRMHNWWAVEGVRQDIKPPLNLLNTHDPIQFNGASARYVRIVAAGPIGDSSAAQAGLYGNWGSPNYWGSSEVRFYTPAAEYSQDVDELDFGGVGTGLSKDLTIVVSNIGKASMQINSIVIEGSTAYSVTTANSFSVAAGASSNVTVRFAPTAVGDYKDIRLVIEHDGGGVYAYCMLNGVAFTPGTADVDPNPPSGSEIDFGEANLNQPKIRAVVLKNLGDTDLNVSAVNITGAGFANATALPLVVPANNGEALLKLSLTPTAEISYAGLASITTDDPDEGTLAYTLLGVGVIAPPAGANESWLEYY